MAQVTCNTCGGAGTYTNSAGDTVTCYACGGSGKVHEQHQPQR
jgi:DnaJ-class molecular chaperone